MSGASPHQPGPATAQLPLSRGLIALVDAADYERLSAFNWFAGDRYPLRNGRRDGRRVSVPLHHEVIGRPPPGLVTDHINGDRLDNRRANLRFCTYSENMWNRGVNCSSKTGFKGVSVAKGRYRAVIRRWGKIDCLGTFADPEAAARAYDRAALEAFGEFARLNFPGIA